MNFSQWLNENDQMDSILYTACVLNKISQNSLLAEMQKECFGINNSGIPQNWIKRAHHMTLKFAPTQQDINNISSQFGQEVKLSSTQWAIDDYCIAIIVENDKGLKTADVPHITVANSKSVNPVYSKTLLTDKSKWRQLNSPIHLVSYVVGVTKHGTIPNMSSILATQ